MSTGTQLFEKEVEAIPGYFKGKLITEKELTPDGDLIFKQYIEKKDPVSSPEDRIADFIHNHPKSTIQPEKKADRYNTDKRKWSLVHWKSMEPLVEVLEFGTKKYAPDNWKKGLDKKEILESMMRHLTALMDGEKLDPESQKRHIGHIMCNTMFYSYFEEVTE